MELLREIDDTFCIAVLGDFLGDAGHTATGREAAWVPRRVTPDNLVDLLGLRPTLRIADPGGGAEEVRFAALDDFSPDRLFHRLDRLAPLRQALEEVRTDRAREPSPRPPEETGAPPTGLLDAILDETAPEADGPTPGSREELEAFVHSVVRPHLVHPDEEGPARMARIEEALEAPLSAILHAPAFQALESMWRSLVVLLSRAGSSGNVRVYAIQLPRGELERDLKDASDLPESRLSSLLARPELGPAARRWSVVVGAYSFGCEAGDLDLLGRVARIARAAGVPWVSSFSATASGDRAEPWGSAPPSDWEAFRRRPELASLALTYPRFLVREPFGEARPASKTFRYREPISSAADLLWGHGGFLVAALQAQEYASHGRGLPEPEAFELAGMPQAQLQRGGEARPVSTEEALDLPSANRVMSSGVIPLVSIPARAAVRLGSIRSLSESGPAKGRW